MIGDIVLLDDGGLQTPENKYQYFVSAYVLKNPLLDQRQAIANANELWRNSKGDEEKVGEFIKIEDKIEIQ